MDTGPVVAYLDAADPAHTHVAKRWDAFGGRLVTTSAVVTEAMHFVAATLIEKYTDSAMDFADATLVLLAEALKVRDVLTLDRRGFRTFRTRAGKALRLVLDEGVAQVP